MFPTSSKSNTVTFAKVTCLLLVATVSLTFFWWMSNSSPAPYCGAGLSSQAPSVAAQRSIDEAFGRIEMSFEANQGQTDGSVDFLARGPGYTLFLKPEEATFSRSRDKDGKGKTKTSLLDLSQNLPSVVKLKLLGGNEKAEPVGSYPSSSKVNYFIGNDPNRWHSNVSSFSRVRYSGVYEGIDVEYYGNQKQLEYDFHVAPSADYRRISMRFEGAESVTLDEESGDLLIDADGDTLRQHKPLAYQEVSGELVEVEKHNNRSEFDTRKLF